MSNAKFMISSISHPILSEFYFVYFYTDDYTHINDVDIAKLLEMSIEDFIELALSFRAIRDNGIIFVTQSDAQKFADYLNDKYLVMLKLTGKI